MLENIDGLLVCNYLAHFQDKVIDNQFIASSYGSMVNNKKLITKNQ